MNKVSVIIPTHNSEKYIKETIKSVIDQTYKNIEIIIIDDISTDNTINIIKSINDKRIKIHILKEHAYVGIARNKGVDLSTGDFICYLDDDDIYNKNKIEKQLKFMLDNDYAFTYTNFIYVKENGKVHKANLPKKMRYKDSLKNTCILTSTVMFNMNILNKKDIYMPNVKKGQDTLTWWKVLKKGITAYKLNEYLTNYNIHSNSLSSNKFNDIKRTWNIYKYEKLPLYKRIYCFICYAFNAVKRRIL